jgi:hypothetical protein
LHRLQSLAVAVVAFARPLVPLLQPVLDCRSCRRFCLLILPIM